MKSVTNDNDLRDVFRQICELCRPPFEPGCIVDNYRVGWLGTIGALAEMASQDFDLAIAFPLESDDPEWDPRRRLEAIGAAIAVARRPAHPSMRRSEKSTKSVAGRRESA